MRKNLGLKTTYVDRNNSNAFIYGEVNKKVEEEGSKKRLLHLEKRTRNSEGRKC